MITTPTIGATFAQAAHLLAAHLAHHALPEPALLELISKTNHSRLTAQVPSLTMPTIATELLTWANTLTTITAQAWRPPTRHRVHLAILSTLSPPTDTVELTIFGGTDHDPTAVGELAPGKHREVTLSELHTWATTASATSHERANR